MCKSKVLNVLGFLLIMILIISACTSNNTANNTDLSDENNSDTGNTGNTEEENNGDVENLEESEGEEVGEDTEEELKILGFTEARDFIAEYFSSEYGIEQSDLWIEQDMTPEGLVGSSTFRFVSGPLTIKISAPVVAPENIVYTIEEASYISNGFYWEGTLNYFGDIEEILVLLPGTVLDEESARDAVLDYLVDNYDLPEFGEWSDDGLDGMVEDGIATNIIVYTSGTWTVEVKYEPAAPLISTYHVTVENSSDGFLWEGDVTLRGEITEIINGD